MKKIFFILFSCLFSYSVYSQEGQTMIHSYDSTHIRNMKGGGVGTYEFQYHQDTEKVYPETVFKIIVKNGVPSPGEVKVGGSIRRVSFNVAWDNFSGVGWISIPGSGAGDIPVYIQKQHKTTDIRNQTISSAKTITDSYINVADTEIQGNGNINIHAERSVTIKPGVNIKGNNISIKTTEQRNRAMHPISQINFVKEMIEQNKAPYKDAYNRLIVLANSFLNQTPNPVEIVDVPLYYDDPQGHNAGAKNIREDGSAAYTLALAYLLSGNETYGRKACTFINAWATTNKHCIKWHNDGMGALANAGVCFLMAAEILRFAPFWSQTDKDIFESWVISVYYYFVNVSRQDIENRGAWGAFASLMASSYLNDVKEMQANRDILINKTIPEIATDGTLPGEWRREEKGMWYSYYFLAPTTATAWAIYNLTGENVFYLSKNGSSIPKALDYFYYYCKNPTQWPHYTDYSKLDMPAPNHWPAALLEAMGSLYGTYGDYIPDQYQPVMEYGHHHAWVFPTLMPPKFSYSSTALRNAMNTEREEESMSNILSLSFENSQESLAQNYPNPFKDHTHIRYRIGEGVSSAGILIYDLQGRMVKNIPIEERGSAEVFLDASDLSSGIYLYSLVIDGVKIETRRMCVR